MCIITKLMRKTWSFCVPLEKTHVPWFVGPGITSSHPRPTRYVVDISIHDNNRNTDK